MTARLLAKNDEISKKKEDERRKVENKVYILKIQVEHAEQEYNACVGNKGKRGG